ncbi:uncharacterized protein LOC135331442 [Halichondria panicea]|uniref:uncharacterized protein LOC135331442 n=1 Tax=Halichondria panicea TaxID=6063 RepID=UPI00312BBE05
METGNTDIGLETMNMISTIDEDEKLQTSNFPPLIYGPDSLYVTVGEEAVLVFNVTDDKGSINLILVDGLPAGATLLPTPKGDYTIEYTFRLELDKIADISLVFLATDDLDAGSTLEVQIVICVCENNGNCTLEGVVDQSTSTVVSNCVCPQEGLLTIAPPVTVPEEATGNVIIVEINGFNLYTFTVEVQMQFSAATADAINVYCEDNDCLVSYPEARTRRNTLTADNLYIAEIASSGESGISFSMYARLDGGFLSGRTLATTVLDYHDEYAALGFEVTDVRTIGTEPTYPPIILTINQIIGIGVGGGLGLILILVLIITITCCCVKGRSREPKSRARGRGLEYMNSGTGFDLKPIPHTVKNDVWF